MGLCEKCGFAPTPLFSEGKFVDTCIECEEISVKDLKRFSICEICNYEGQHVYDTLFHINKVHRDILIADETRGMIQWNRENKRHYLPLYDRELKEIPEEVFELELLTSLDLSDNHISEIPIKILKLKNLGGLDLSKNQFTEFPVILYDMKGYLSINLNDNDISSLPDGISKMVNFHEITISRNNFSSWPQYLPPNLSHLNISNNQISQLPSSISELKSLKTLWVSHNLISEIPEELFALPLRELELDYNQINFLPRNIEKL